MESLKPEEVALFPEFHHRILMVRDPRDAIVSRLLYMTWDRRFIDDDNKLDRFIEALVQKETDPGSISVVELFALVGSLDRSSIIDDVVGLNGRTVDFWRQHRSDFLLVRYEDFVDGNLTNLSNYLGFAIDHQVEVDNDLRRVVRTKSHGDFKRWFTEQDHVYFADRFGPMLDTFGYDREDDLEPQPVIEPRYSSEYVLGLVAEKRSRLGIAPFVPGTTSVPAAPTAGRPASGEIR